MHCQSTFSGRSKRPLKTAHSHRSKRALIGAVLSAVLLSGCSSLEPYKAPITQGNVMTQESVNSLQEGLTKNQVRELLGPPFAVHPFQPNHWEYVFYTAYTDFHQKTEHHLKLRFDQDGMLSTWKVLPKKEIVEHRGFF